MRIKTEQLCRDFLLIHPAGVTYSSYTASQAMHARWGIKLDHHEFAYAIDLLVQQGKAVRIPNGKIYPEFSILEAT